MAWGLKASLAQQHSLWGMLAKWEVLAQVVAAPLDGKGCVPSAIRTAVIQHREPVLEIVVHAEPHAQLQTLNHEAEPSHQELSFSPTPNPESPKNLQNIILRSPEVHALQPEPLNSKPYMQI